MKNKPLITGIAASIAMLILILDSQTALTGAKEGLELCLTTVIPSLFPFFLISITLTSSLSGISLPILRPLGRLCGIPQGAETILISGFLGGYPAGAQSIAAAWKAGHLQKKDAQRMLAFCNNAGPAFLFGMTASVFSEPWIPWMLWAIHIGSAILTSLLLPIPDTGPVRMVSQKTGQPISQSLHSAIQVMASVCGWVILFRIMIAFLRRWLLWILPPEAQVAVIGFLELSNGCLELSAISSAPLRFILCSVFLACGGLCVGMQTQSVTNGLSLSFYIFGKAMQTLFSLLLSAAVIFGYAIPAFLAVVFFITMMQKRKNRSSIPTAIGV